MRYSEDSQQARDLEEKIEKFLRKRHEEYATKKDCFVCGKHSDIVELHHAIEVGKYKKLLRVALDLGAINECYNPQFWLCPNCHTYIHNLMRCGGAINICNEEQIKKFKEIIERGNSSINWLEEKVYSFVNSNDKFFIRSNFNKITRQYSYATRRLDLLLEYNNHPR